jgi:hypothetical protein
MEGLVTHHGKTLITQKLLNKNSQTVLMGNNLGNGNGLTRLNIKIATWNVMRMIHKVNELMKELDTQHIDTAIISEQRRKNRGSVDLDTYMMIYSDISSKNWAASGVANLIKKHLKYKIIRYTSVSPSII